MLKVGRLWLKLCGHHDDYHTYAVKLQEASRRPAFPTGFPLRYRKAQKEDSLSQIFLTHSQAYVQMLCWAVLFEDCLLTRAYSVLALLCNNVSEDLQHESQSLQTPCLRPSESKNSGRENPWDGNSVICAATWSKQAAALPAGRRQCLGASMGHSQWPDRRQLLEKESSR